MSITKIFSICICICIAAIGATDVETPVINNPKANFDVSSDTLPDGAIQDIKPTQQQGAFVIDLVQNLLFGEQEELE
ncbi:unnamed protein product [Trichobilharzia regenti]|uniref:Secreted protein n=1 Tax=Trichobilharzia regenti TaxID=157069 RepID=A0A183VW92_TRIRE|nr:unnamed protein product [Trichobilharzia regenti]VDQ00628.1 unnamed protein product [Trichobilharzia regenti]